MIKTINLNGFEIKVTELGGDNTEIINNSTGKVYASKLPNITVGGDEVIAIPAGAIDGLYGTHGTVYLLGTGSVELRGVDHKITETRSQSVGGSIGVVQDYIDSKDTATLAAAQNYADSIKAELAGFIGYTDNDIYGLEADFENCKFTRLAGAVGKTAGADFDSINAYGGRRRCNLSDSGEVLAYYGDENFKADGSNGQVMVEQPKFYYRVIPLKTEKIDGADGYHLRKARYYISDTPKAGFKVHPAFVRNGVEVDKIYLSAFEGCVYDTSAGAYLLEDEQIVDFDIDKLSSISDAKPCSGVTQALTRANARKLAHNRGVGWEQVTIQAVSATQILFIIEYASFNSQLAIGDGITSSRNAAPEHTGITAAIGNNTGMIAEYKAISYRGEENIWGNLSPFVDGVSVYNYTVGSIYISDHGFTDGTPKENYKDSGLCVSKSTGYVSFFGYSGDFDWLFIPTESYGNSALPVGDYFEQNRNTQNIGIVIYGGHFNTENKGGIFCYRMHTSETIHTSTVGCRLLYVGNCQ